MRCVDKWVVGNSLRRGEKVAVPDLLFLFILRRSAKPISRGALLPDLVSTTKLAVLDTMLKTTYGVFGKLAFVENNVLLAAVLRFYPIRKPPGVMRTNMEGCRAVYSRGGVYRSNIMEDRRIRLGVSTSSPFLVTMRQSLRFTEFLLERSVEKRIECKPILGSRRLIDN